MKVRSRTARRGQSMVEYAIILVLIACVCIGVISVLGNQVSASFQDIEEALMNPNDPGAEHRLAVYGAQARPDHAAPEPQNAATAGVLAPARPAGRAQPVHRDPALAGSEPVRRAGPGGPQLFAAADSDRQRQRGRYHG